VQCTSAITLNYELLPFVTFPLLFSCPEHNLINHGWNLMKLYTMARAVRWSAVHKNHILAFFLSITEWIGKHFVEYCYWQESDYLWNDFLTRQKRSLNTLLCVRRMTALMLFNLRKDLVINVDLKQCTTVRKY
jgi:hypothetical protein